VTAVAGASSDARSYAIRLRLPTLDATCGFAAALAGCLQTGDFVGLSGDLGVGKTVIAREIIRVLSGRADEEVASPTFNLVLVYSYPQVSIWHFDLYRIGAPEETFELGLEDALAEGIALVEWPERLGTLLPDDRFDIALKHDGDGRLVDVSAAGAAQARLAALDLERWTHV